MLCNKLIKVIQCLLSKFLHVSLLVQIIADHLSVLFGNLTVKVYIAHNAVAILDGCCLCRSILSLTGQWCVFLKRQCHTRICLDFEHIGFQFDGLLRLGREVYVLNLICPVELNIVGSFVQYVAVRRFALYDLIFAKRQSNLYFTKLTVVDNAQEVVGCLSTSRSEYNSISCSIATGDSSDHIANLVPYSAVSVCIDLIVLSQDIFGSDDFEFGTGQRLFLIGKLTILEASENFTGFADTNHTQSLIVVVLFLNQQVILIILIEVPSCFVNAIGSYGKINVEVAGCVSTVLTLIEQDTILTVLCGVDPLVVEAFRTVDFDNAITANFQLLRQYDNAISSSVESIDLLGRRAICGRCHGHQTGITLLIQNVIAVVIDPIQLESSPLPENRLTGFIIDLYNTQICFHQFIQNGVLHVAAGRSLYSALGIREARYRDNTAVRIHINDYRISLELIFGNSSLNQQILSIGQAPYANITCIIGEDLAQLILICVAGRNPAIALAVCEITCISQGFVVSSDFGRVTFVGLCDCLCFTREIPLRMILIVGIVYRLFSRYLPLREVAIWSALLRSEIRYRVKPAPSIGSLLLSPLLETRFASSISAFMTCS